MREIKFRAWNGEEMIYDWFKTVYNPPTKCMDVDMPENYTWACNSSSARAVMQYTELKDKNGREVYEGDIINFKESYRDDNGDIKYKYAVIKFYESLGYDGDKGIGSGFYFQDELEYGWHVSDYEVIGDIYTTPELLTNKG